MTKETDSVISACDTIIDYCRDHCGSCNSEPMCTYLLNGYQLSSFLIVFRDSIKRGVQNESKRN